VYCNTGNRLGDEGFQQLIQMLPSLPHLTVLDVSSNGLTEQSLDSLASLLKSPSTSALQVHLLTLTVVMMMMTMMIMIVGSGVVRGHTG